MLGVATLVLEDGGDEEEVIAALLHDAVEDQGGEDRLREIRGRFGNRVAGIVQGCTDTDAVPKPAWRPRKEAYLRHLGEAPVATMLWRVPTSPDPKFLTAKAPRTPSMEWYVRTQDLKIRRPQEVCFLIPDSEDEFCSPWWPWRHGGSRLFSD